MNKLAVAENLREIASYLERLEIPDGMDNDDGRAEAWSRVWSELWRHNRKMSQHGRSGIENALAEIRRLQALDVRHPTVTGGIHEK